MRSRIIDAPHGSHRAGDNYQALVRGPVVLARDENTDSLFNKPVMVIAREGYVDLTPETPDLPSTKMQFRIPVKNGFIKMVDYASVNSWDGKQVCTWLPKMQ